MKYSILFYCFLGFSLSLCNKEKKAFFKEKATYESDLLIAFGSCNNQREENLMWKSILANDPDLFVWGGDIVYSDTEDLNRMRSAYQTLKTDSAYVDFNRQIEILGTWDDHDYGLNDGGREWIHKDSVQQILLDFLDVDENDSLRTQQGVYQSKKMQIDDSIIKIIILDTRYFRSKLTKDPSGKKRYIPTTDTGGTMLGEKQWKWLDAQLADPKVSFNIIVSSIQFLSGEHGFETWGNMPHEVDRMIKILQKNKPKGVLFLSGDRHIAEISSRDINGLNYPLIDFTSSGMTHSYSSFSGENNAYRVSEVVSDKNFGLIRFDLTQNKLKLEIRSEDDELLQSYEQQY